MYSTLNNRLQQAEQRAQRNRNLGPPTSSPPSSESGNHHHHHRRHGDDDADDGDDDERSESSSGSHSASNTPLPGSPQRIQQMPRVFQDGPLPSIIDEGVPKEMKITIESLDSPHPSSGDTPPVTKITLRHSTSLVLFDVYRT